MPRNVNNGGVSNVGFDENTLKYMYDNSMGMGLGVVRGGSVITRTLWSGEQDL